jgi:hypothetical protein
MSKATKIDANVGIGSEWFTYAGPHEAMFEVVSLVITKQDGDSSDRYRCKYTSNETGHVGKFDWINGCYLFSTRDEAWEAAAKRMDEQAAGLSQLAAKYRGKAASERNETTACPDQHLCRHGIDN